MSTIQNKALPTQGTQIFYGVDLAHATTKLGGVKDIAEFPKATLKKVDTTRVDQVDSLGNMDPYEQFMYDRINSGQLRSVLGADQDQIAAVMALQGTFLTFKVVFSSGAYLWFLGGFGDNGLMPKTGDEATYDITVDVSGKATFVKAPVLTGVVGGAGDHTLTLTFSSAITAASVPIANVLVAHGGALAIAATTVVQGAANTLVATNTAWQASPTGDSYMLAAVLGVCPGAVGVIA